MRYLSALLLAGSLCLVTGCDKKPKAPEAEKVTEAAEKKAPEAAEKKAPEAAEKKAPEAADKKAPEAAEKKAPEAAEKKAPEAAEKKAPEAAEKKAPEAAEKKAPEAAEKKAPEASANVASLKAGYEAYNAGKIDEVLTHFTDDADWNAVGMPPMKGKVAIKAWMDDYRAGFPDSLLHVTRMFDLGQAVAAEVVATGTHKGDFMGMKPSNNAVGVPAMHIYWFNAEGKIHKAATYTDGMSLMKQVGAAPADAMAADTVPTPEGAATIVTGTPNPKNIANFAKMMKAMAGPPEGMAAFISDATTMWDASMNKTLTGPKEFGEMMQMYAKAFPDAKPTPGQVHSVGDFVIFEVVWSGTHSGPLGELPATNKKISVQVAEVQQWGDDGKLVSAASYSNNVEMATQLGLMGDTPPAADKK